MDKEQQNILREHHARLVAGIDQLESILDYLYTEKVLSDNVVHRIKREKDPQEQNRMLLSSIKKRPPPDFEKFVRVLCLTDNEHLADLLLPGSSSRYMNTANPANITKMSKPTGSGIHHVDHGHHGRTPVRERSEETGGDDDGGSVLAMGEDFPPLPPYNLPEVWPDEKRLKTPVSVRRVASDDMKKKFTQVKAAKPEPSDMYRMGGRSRAIIISNTIFHDQNWNRYGNKLDEDRMKALLEKLNFEVEVWADQTEDELFRPNGKLSTESRVGSDQYNCFLMVILTHGQKEKIMTADNQYVLVSSIVDYFDTSRCYRFAGKPKIFFVQACQGDEKDNGTIPQRVAEVTERFNGMNIETTDSGLVPRSGEKQAYLSDMIVVNATVPGFVSWRNLMYGTWFIQAIVEVFSNCACDLDLITMLTKVNNLVSLGRSASGGHVQISNVTTYTLRKSVYFFPGLNES